MSIPDPTLRLAAILCAAVALLTASPALADTNPAGAEPFKGDAILRAFHGKEGIDRMTDDFVDRLVADPRIGARFRNANLVRLRLELKHQFCYVAGGPCTYDGKTMTAAHAGMNLTNRDFNALVEDLQHAMDKERVPFTAQNQFLAKFAPMQHPIVTK